MLDILERSLFKMARIEEKSKKTKNLLNKVLLWVAVGFLSAVLVASIVIFVLWIVGNNNDEDNEFVENCKVKFEICVEDLTFNVSYCCWKILVFFLSG
jgi:flagellar basal body-associated protein FliL